MNIPYKNYKSQGKLIIIDAYYLFSTWQQFVSHFMVRNKMVTSPTLKPRKYSQDSILSVNNHKRYFLFRKTLVPGCLHHYQNQVQVLGTVQLSSCSSESAALATSMLFLTQLCYGASGASHLGFRFSLSLWKTLSVEVLPSIST